MDIFIFCLGIFVGILAACGVVAYAEGEKINELETKIEELKRRMLMNS